MPHCLINYGLDRREGNLGQKEIISIFPLVGKFSRNLRLPNTTILIVETSNISFAIEGLC